ncbi:MAG: caspase family protein [Rhizobiaceae bacterium]|nr:caspase family protein [Rhizobiaceae bacterium]
MRRSTVPWVNFAARSLVGALLLVTLAAVPAWAQEALRGVALVIGQSDYEHIAPLPNPENDADAIDELLSDLGFDVTGVSSADQKKLARALDRFVEDAEDADVALIYYSGHGIEAAGENFLVPVDADLAALDDAGTRLVPMSKVLEQLQATVPVTIVLLDACRDNPFPAGATVRVAAGAEPVALAAGGLSAPVSRGASALARTSDPAAAENYGALVGFAAAPGRVALDGDAGGNSPYAAALIKHLSAGGYAFGDVMTLVSEEVWLRTRAAQTPWTNTSLRRQLFFGEAVEDGVDADEAAIRGERRGLLLKIASLGAAERQQVAARAEEGGVPMDALFAMLAAVGAEAPQDPAELDSLLKQQAERLKGILADRAALTTTDAELVRLAALADQAIGEGALQSAIALNERAKARVQELSGRVDDAEAQIAARRAEFAAVYASSAQTYALAGDHAAAAEDYHRAFEQIERWDTALAWRYRTGEADALVSLGHYGGDNAALARSVEVWEAALALAPRAERPVDWATTQAGLADALWTRGDRLGVRADSEAAIAALETALTVLSREQNPDEWADAQALLGAVLLTHHTQDADDAGLRGAAAALEAALEVRTRDSAPAEWARVRNRLGLVLYTLAQRDTETDLLEEALAIYDEMLEQVTRDDAPLDWAQFENNRALVLSVLGGRMGDEAMLRAAVDAYRGVIEIETRDRMPILWAEGQGNLGSVLWQLSLRTGGTEELEMAADAFRAALEVVSRDVSPLRWAALQDNLGLALKDLGERTENVALVEQSLAAFDLALEERRRDRGVLEWAGTTNNLAGAYYTLAEFHKDAGRMERAVDLYRQAQSGNQRSVVPLEWARATNNLALALHALGAMQQDPALLAESAATYRLSMEEATHERTPVDWGLTQYNLARVLLDLGRLEADPAAFAQALEANGNAREVYMAAGMQNYAPVFDNLEMEITMADLQAQVDARMKALQAEQGAVAKPGP